MLFLMFKGKLCFILKVIEIVVLFLIVDNVSWLYVELIGFDDVMIYLVDNLCSGICVVFLIDVELLLWLMMKILFDVLIKIDLIFFWKFCSFNVGGRIICLLDDILIFLLIWVFIDGVRCGDVVMFIWILFFDVMYIFFVEIIIFFMNIIIKFFFLFFMK